MGFLGTFLGFMGFSIGIPIGLFLGFLFFIYFEPRDVKDPIIRPLYEFDSSSLLDLLPEIPLWVKYPDYDRVDWLNKFINDMWPYFDKAICEMIQSKAKPIFAEYIGMYQIRKIDFESLSLGTLPVSVHGIKVYETIENELVLEPMVRWAGIPNVTLAVDLFSLQIRAQLLDVQVFVAPRIILKSLVPAFPCFASISVSLLEKPHIDFGLKLMGGDVMAIPGLYHFVQETIKKQVASLYLWPQTLEIPILDSSVGATKKPIGIVHVKVIRALKLLKMDLIGASDPYVTLSLSGERLPTRKTSIKMKNLNPVWNEDFKLTVKDPQSQVLELHVLDWEKVGTHDKLGMQVIPLRLLNPHETKDFELDLVKNMNPNDPHNKKPRGKIVVKVTLIPFKDDFERFSGPLDKYSRNPSRGVGGESEDRPLHGAGLLMVMVQGAQYVEGKHHNNPYAIVLFRGEEKKTKMMKKTQEPNWNEEFQFLLEEAPLKEKMHIAVMSKRRGFSLRSKEMLGHIDINLNDVIYNGRINEKYHLINSRNGVLHVEMRWKVV